MGDTSWSEAYHRQAVYDRQQAARIQDAQTVVGEDEDRPAHSDIMLVCVLSLLNGVLLGAFIVWAVMR